MLAFFRILPGRGRLVAALPLLLAFAGDGVAAPADCPAADATRPAYCDPETAPVWSLPELDRVVSVPQGSLRPGDHFGDGMSDTELYNGPPIVLKAFEIDAYEVSNAKYAEFVAATGHRKPRYANVPQLSRPYQPVVGVSYDDAEAYCAWRGKRLPTELEWERAAVGETGGRYPWGDDEVNAGGVWRANVGDGRTVRPDGPRHGADGFIFPAPVGSFPRDRSSYGVYDMAGNVSEWTSSDFLFDFYLRLEYAKGVVEAVMRPTDKKVVRGGSWANSAWSARIPGRNQFAPFARTASIGFRCARTPAI